MKLVKIFGMVLALHIVLLTIFFLSPGCQSTPRTVAEAPPVEAPVVPVSENWSSRPAPISPAPGPVLSGLTPAERARLAPSRPDDPSSFIGADAPPPVLAPAPVAAPAGPATYTVAAGDSLWKIARKFGTTTAELMKINAGLKADALRPGDVVNLPAGAASASSAPATTTTQAVTSSAATSTYVVRSGDSLSRIAARNGTTVAALRQANNLRSDVLQIGQALVIPGGVASQGAPTIGETPAAPAARGAGGVRVTVGGGETLGSIAARFDVTVAELMAANNITDPRRLRAGQELVIPGFQPVGAPAPAPAPAPRTPAPAAPAPVAPPPLPAPQPAPLDLDTLVPLDAPVVPIDEPVPQP